MGDFVSSVSSSRQMESQIILPQLEAGRGRLGDFRFYSQMESRVIGRKFELGDQRDP